MLGASTGSLRCFKRCEDCAYVALVFIVVSGVPLFVEDHFAKSASSKPKPSTARIFCVLQSPFAPRQIFHLHLARCRTECVVSDHASVMQRPARGSPGRWPIQCPLPTQ